MAGGLAVDWLFKYKLVKVTDALRSFVKEVVRADRVLGNNNPNSTLNRAVQSDRGILVFVKTRWHRWRAVSLAFSLPLA